jgi:hypothetical protein
METVEQIDRAFAPIADAVAKFAQAESCQIEKCPRGNSGWELTRPHRLGGTLTLLLLHDPSLGLGVGSVWQFPCPEMSLLYTHFRNLRPCALAPDDVVTALQIALQEIMRVPFGYWTNITPLSTADMTTAT